MKKFILIIILLGVLFMLKPVSAIIKDSIANIMYRGNVVTGTVAVVNGDGSYDVFISESDRAYPKIFTLSANPDLAVGDKVRILYKGGCKELPIILPPTTTGISLFESQLVYQEGEYMNAYGATWIAYFFQAESSHTVEKIALLLNKEYEPGIITAAIYPNEGSGNFKPVIGGGALTSGTTDGDTLPSELEAPEWREIEVTPYSLVSGTWYSIVLSATLGWKVNWFGTNENILPDQWRHISTDNGANWYAGQFELTYKIYGR